MLKLAFTPYAQIGNGAIAYVREALDDLDALDVLLVVDRSAFGVSGAASAIRPALHGRNVSKIDRFHANPRMTDIEQNLRAIRNARYDAVLAIGGGSAMDMGKILAALSQQDASPRDIVRGDRKIEQPALPIIAVPTTAGTGAEATHFSAIWVEGVKHSLADRSMLPLHAAVDPELTYSLPPDITASTGLDALCQAIESLWSVGANEQSSAFAMRAVQLALEHLETAVNDPTPAARLGMCEAAHLAGRAINISKTTASHAISYTLTSQFGVPHGVATALTIGPMLAYNAGVSERDCTDPRGPARCAEVIDRLIKVIGCIDVADAQHRIDTLLEQLGCPNRLSKVGVTEAKQRQMIAQHVNTERLSNNPRALDVEKIAQLLEQIG